jgi:hypothetical protein
VAARRFAEDTRVPIGQTQAEIKDRLRKAGADQIAVYEASDRSAVAFQLGASMYRINVPTTPKAEDQAQDERRAWRLLGLLMKSKLEAIREGATTVEREFLADMLLYDGRTVSETIGPELQIAQREGRMPSTLLLGGPGR